MPVLRLIRVERTFIDTIPRSVSGIAEWQRLDRFEGSLVTRSPK